MKLLNLSLAIGLAALFTLGCENSSTTTGTSPPAGTSGKPVVKKLTVKAAAQQSLKQGDTDELSIKIERDNFNDPVTIRLNDLPKGVVCVENEVVIPAGATSTKLTLKAAPNAELGEHEVKIDAQAAGVDENIQTFKLDVKDKG